jgi:hypothetical protein
MHGVSVRRPGVVQLNKHDISLKDEFVENGRVM